ncbi:hypothetical protein WR25_23129 [Diploscapter pachys]|uniref:Receptor L-domain domain-containing protein n=1 Tax=Diploscapter pachys TaxID=2018661 RepID=A0A2A2JFV8_9BILA|nr:hypothetical protein WR25_23129 [Diploscapter pachys]
MADFSNVTEDCTVITGSMVITNMNDIGPTYEEITKMLSNVEEIPCFVITAVNYKDLAFLSKVTKINCEKDVFNKEVAGFIVDNENLERIGMPNVKECNKLVEQSKVKESRRAAGPGEKRRRGEQPATRKTEE